MREPAGDARHRGETLHLQVSSLGDYGGREREEVLCVEPNVWMVHPAFCS